MRILVVEDDDRLRKNISTLLTRAYYAVDEAECGMEGLEKGFSEEYDCILMDWMLPDKDGVDVVAELRAHNINTPVVMLTARTLPDDVVAGLDKGADDFVSKPFDVDVLLARIRAVLRRKVQTTKARIMTAGSLSIQPASREVTVSDTVLSLTPKEYAILEYLMYYKNQTVSRIDLISHVWDENANLFSNTVDVYISYLRKKLAKFHEDQRLQTIKGVGYRLCDD